MCCLRSSDFKEDHFEPDDDHEDDHDDDVHWSSTASVVDGDMVDTCLRAKSVPIRNLVCVKTSTLGEKAGKGLFSCIDLPQWAIIGEYSHPKHSIVVNPKIEGTQLKISPRNLGYNKTTNMHHYIRRTVFCMKGGKGLAIIPKQSNVLRYINDVIDLSVFNQLLTTDERLNFYENEDVIKKYNVDWLEDSVNDRVYVVTVKPIPAGCELFISYGVDYWESLRNTVS